MNSYNSEYTPYLINVLRRWKPRKKKIKKPKIKSPKKTHQQIITFTNHPPAKEYLLKPPVKKL